MFALNYNFTKAPFFSWTKGEKPEKREFKTQKSERRAGEVRQSVLASLSRSFFFSTSVHVLCALYMHKAPPADREIEVARVLRYLSVSLRDSEVATSWNRTKPPAACTFARKNQPGPYYLSLSLNAAVLHVNYRGSLGFGQASIDSPSSFCGTNTANGMMQTLQEVVAAVNASPEAAAAAAAAGGTRIDPRKNCVVSCADSILVLLGMCPGALLDSRALRGE
jgi:hypothetical protein